MIVTEVFAAREPKQDFSSAQLVQTMKHSAIQFISELNDVSNYLIDHLTNGDVLMVLSAGDADQITTQVLHHFQESEANLV